ncbi:MAG: ADP-ribosylglycohydrolase family protein [Megasphaera sp.]|jgi:type I restriction enzyme M protein|nr:ADP-ribosylglycohydrolase family protein [Megasphaera sp.]MCI1247755.1 ADP-ribosylglycohydrolase family protein [Megasphaera sp.]
MLGTMIGDIVGSSFERSAVPMKNRDFTWFGPGSHFTDDTVTTVAVAAALLEGKQSHCGYIDPLRRHLRYWCRKYPHCGYGRLFEQWFLADQGAPYGSYGNGAAMRVAPAAWAGSSLDEVQALAELTAVVSHDHPEAVKGAVAVASAVYLARTGKTKDEIRTYVQQYFYPLNRTIDEIRPGYQFTSAAAQSVPEAIEAFLDSVDFSDAIRNAVSLGGDTDTQAAMAGAIAEAYFGVPAELWQKAQTYIPADMQKIILSFRQEFMEQKK